MDVDTTRVAMLQRRRSLSAATVRRASALVVHRIRSLPVFREAVFVGAYLGIRGEIDPSALFDDPRPGEPAIALPVTEPGRPLRFVVPEGPLAEGPYGIRQPVDGQEVDPMTMDAVLVPLVAADEQGNRVGHGAGFYDRTFAPRATAPPPPVMIGVAHGFQVVPQLDARPWDGPLDLLVTDAGLVVPGMNHTAPPMGKD